MEIYSLRQRIRGLEKRPNTQRLLRQVTEKLGFPEDPFEAEIRRMIAYGQKLEPNTKLIGRYIQPFSV